MSKTKIYDKDRRYNLIRLVIDRYIHHSYRNYECHGAERVPTDGAVIFAPNHASALMDPFAVLALSPQRKVFVARADVFRHPLARKILTFLKIMPINRRRDGLRSVKNNDEIIEKSIDVLLHDTNFCILPEGTHRPKHSLLPLGKGLSRIALGAHKRLQGKKPVYIVPVGCEYGDYYRFRSTLLLQVGEPINISKYIDSHPEMTDPELLVGIKDLTREAMVNQIVYVKDDEDYDAVWELAKLACPFDDSKLRKRFEANRATVARIEAFKEKDPEKAASLFEKVRAFSHRRRENRISLLVTSSRHPVLQVITLTLFALIVLPLFLLYAAASLPVWVVAEILAAGCQDRAFCNTMRCVSCFILWTIIFIVDIVLAFCFLPWYWAIAALVVVLPAPMLVYDCFELYRRVASTWRWVFMPSLRKERKELLDYFSKVCSLTCLI